MQTVRKTLGVFTLLVSVASDVPAQSKPDLSGKWVTEFVRTTSDIGLGVELTITLADGFLTLEFASPGKPPTPQKLKFKLDGAESKNSLVAENGFMDQISTAAWIGNTLVVTTALPSGSQRRTFELDGSNLVISTSSAGSPPRRLVYKRVRS